MPLIYVQIHAYTYIYQRIHTYTYIYMKIRMLNDKVWIVVRCQCPAVTRTRCRPAPDTDWDCQWAARWPLTGHRSPAASGPGRLGGGWACHWPCRRAAGGLPLSVTGRPPWRRTNEWKNWAYQADPRLCQCQVSSTGLVPEWLECGISTLLFLCCLLELCTLCPAVKHENWMHVVVGSNSPKM